MPVRLDRSGHLVGPAGHGLGQGGQQRQQHRQLGLGDGFSGGCGSSRHQRNSVKALFVYMICILKLFDKYYAPWTFYPGRREFEMVTKPRNLGLALAVIAVAQLMVVLDTAIV